MKIVQIITRLDKGGSAELVLQTCAMLVEKNFEVLLISGKTKNPPFDINKYAETHGFNILYVNSLVRNINPVADFLAFFKLWRILRKDNPDILHTNTSKAGFIGRIAGRWAGIGKIFHSPHGHIFYGYYSKLVTKIFIWMERLAARHCTKIFNLTEKGRQDHIVQKIGKPEKFVVSSCGVDLEKFQNFQPKILQPGRKVVLWIGRFVPIKNPAMALQVAEYCRDADLEFRMVGSGELLEKARHQQHSKNPDNVVFTGYQSDILPELQAADLFIITSNNEGFGRVIVEAMAAGLPVIATSVGGIPEIIKPEENGYLVPARDAQQMSVRIKRILRDKQQYDNISKNNILASKKYSTKNYVNNLTKYYQ